MRGCGAGRCPISSLPLSPHQQQLQTVRETLTSPVHCSAELSAHGPFSFPSHLSLCPAGRKAMPICPSQPRPTSCSDQLGARIPIACLSLSSAGTSEVQESQLICSARSGAHEFECRRAVPVLIPQEATQPLPLARRAPAALLWGHCFSSSLCSRFGVITLFKPHSCRT